MTNTIWTKNLHWGWKHNKYCVCSPQRYEVCFVIGRFSQVYVVLISFIEKPRVQSLFFSNSGYKLFSLFSMGRSLDDAVQQFNSLVTSQHFWWQSCKSYHAIANDWWEISAKCVKTAKLVKCAIHVLNKGCCVLPPPPPEKKTKGKEVPSLSTVRGAPQNGDDLQVEADFAFIRLTALPLRKFVYLEQKKYEVTKTPDQSALEPKTIQFNLLKNLRSIHLGQVCELTNAHEKKLSKPFGWLPPTARFHLTENKMYRAWTLEYSQI